MNERFRDAHTPEGRLAVVVVSLIRQFELKKGHVPDYVDFEVALKPYLDGFALETRVDEAHLQIKTTQMERLRQLDDQLRAHNEQMKRLRLL